MRLDKRDKQRAEGAEYKRNSAIARKRDKHCRICGAQSPLSSHHVESRAKLRKSPKKHAVENLLTVCWSNGGEDRCHEQLTRNILKVYPNSDRGTNGTVTVEKWSDEAGGYVLAMAAA